MFAASGWLSSGVLECVVAMLQVPISDTPGVQPQRPAKTYWFDKAFCTGTGPNEVCAQDPAPSRHACQALY